jgi:transcriptional regulator with XRE-family HTH domain
VDSLKDTYDDRYRQVGRKIAYYRNKRGWSQDFLADKTGISRSYLSKIEAPGSGKAFSLDVLFLLADALEIEPALLLTPDDK